MLQEKFSNILDAIKVDKIYLNNFSDDYFGYFRHGTLLAKTGKFEKAKYDLEKALNLEQNSPEIYHNLAWVLLSLSIESDCTEYNQEIIFYYQKSVTLYQHIGKIHIIQSIK
jgi:tetratricopeptide (TPR) repeat protein